MTGSPSPRRLAGVSRVWILTAITIPLVAVLALVVVRLPAPDAPVRIPTLVFGALFYVAEITVVHVRFRRDAHSFSMSEFPLVLSLFFLGPLEIIVLSVVGSALALSINRRQRGVKLAFNVTQLALQAAIVVGVFSVLINAGDPLGPRGWMGVVAGVAATVVVSNTMIGAAIRLSGGTLSRHDRTSMYVLSAGAALMNASLALVAATMLWVRPGNGWIALIPPAVLYFAYRAYLGQKRERERLQSLYEVSGELHRLPRIEDALEAAVDRTRAMFDAEEATVVLFPEGPSGSVVVTSSGLDRETLVMRRARHTDPAIARFAVSESTGEVVQEHGRGVAMMVPIPTMTGMGVLSVGTPLSDIGSFGEKDMRLLETLAGHIGVSLRNGHLQDSLARVTELKDLLHERTLLDTLTGLANRERLRQELERALRERRRRSAVMFLDLDDFKSINDTYGHEVGDAVLIEVGRRLKASCRPHDTVARLGGDEYALLLEQLIGPDDVVPVAQRIIKDLARPIVVGELFVETGASLGVAMVDNDDTPDDVLRRADEAMYAAKAQGKGRYQIYREGLPRLQAIRPSA